MASLIPGYEYDIFISYRQKDNKGDKWVSKFVDALKTELEATFKDDVSVYFDENPHDRLQETHNVDKSLESKLRCLIFIPILSQTYCDSNSYAWQYEFQTFLNFTKQDRFGKDIKLRNGNVASRILPIRIHDLEPEDVKVFEKETGSVLRALDFVFKTATGVSRPLKDNEDHPQDNLNKTFYSDQINKVGHAIKEIILAMKKEPRKAENEKKQAEEVRSEEGILIQENPSKPVKNKVIPFVTIVATLVIIAILAYPGIFKHDTIERLKSSGARISVAVMPFQNMTNDTTWNVWQDGIKDELINYLTNYNEELEVRQVESINGLLESKGFNNYASITPSVAGTISKKLNASVFITGSIKLAGDKIRINAQLVDSKTEETLKPFQLEYPARVDTIFSGIDSLKVMVKNYLIISLLKKEASPDLQLFLGSTKSPEALRYYIDGQKAFLKREFPAAIDMFLSALKSDSNYFNPMIYISIAYGNQGKYSDAKKWCNKAFKKSDRLSKVDKLFAEYAHSLYFGTPSDQLKCLKQFLDIDDQQAIMYYSIGLSYIKINQYEKAIPEYERALEIYNNLGIKPSWVYNYTGLGFAYHKNGQYRKERNLYKQAEKDFPNDIALIYQQAVLALSEGKAEEANEYIEKYKSILKEKNSTETWILTSVGNLYRDVNFLDKAEEFYRKSLSSIPDNSDKMKDLAWFLIDKDRNVNEGLELIDRALKIKIDNYSFLDTKGWGLYKIGKYKEALEILQKSWDIRMKNAIYYHEAYLHLEAAKKAVAGQN